MLETLDVILSNPSYKEVPAGPIHNGTLNLCLNKNNLFCLGLDLMKNENYLNHVEIVVTVRRCQ